MNSKRERELEEWGREVVAVLKETDAFLEKIQMAINPGGSQASS